MIFNGVEITQESIIATRQHFADSYQKCIDGVADGSQMPAAHVNIAKYIADLEERKRAMLDGEMEDTFTFIQRAHWIQTGESVALLP